MTMTRRHLLLLTFAVAALAPATASAQDAPAADVGREVAVEGGSYIDLTVSEYQAMAQETEFFLINVHIPFGADLPGTDASVPFDEIQDHIGHLAPEPDTKVLLYCRNGPMSATAAAELVKLGYTKVYNLVGGMNAWAAAGLTSAGQ
jgi:phage shock protein E